MAHPIDFYPEGRDPRETFWQFITRTANGRWMVGRVPGRSILLRLLLGAFLMVGAFATPIEPPWHWGLFGIGALVWAWVIIGTIVNYKGGTA